MLKILRYLTKKDVLIIAIIALLVVGQVWLEIEIPRLLGEMAQAITNPLEPLVLSEIFVTGGIMVALALGSLVAAIISVFLSSKMAAGFARRLREKVFSKVESFSTAEVNNFSPNSLITRTTQDVARVQMIVGVGVRLFVRAPVMAIWALNRIASQNWYYLALMGGAFTVMAILVVFIIMIALPRFRKVQKLLDNINRLTRENLSGIRVVRAYNAENFQTEKFEEANSEMTKEQLFVERSFQIIHPGMALIISGLTVGITLITAFLISGTYEATVQDLLFADMLMFNQYAMMAIMAFVLLIFVFANLPRAVVSAKRILEVLDTQSSIVDGDGVMPIESDIGKVEFRGVSFKYPDAEQNILEDISFTANPGETVAFIGSTGSGKSSLINLAPRFYDATIGEIFISGQNIKDYKLADLNRQIGFVSQKGIIFSGTIKDNIALGEMEDSLSEAEVLEAVEVAQASDFILAKESGLDSHTAQGGTNLSGGQKQRVSIARALAKKPNILIFDDSFSALDYKTDRALRDSLKTEFKGVTQLIVAQRIGTIRDADKIMVLDKGKAVGYGSHSELMATCEIYKEIAFSQLSEEELM